MATSDVAICNLALARVGDEPIAALADNTTRARLCNRIYADTRDRLLDEIRPNFSVWREGFGQLAAAPAYGYSYQYQLAADVLRVLDIEDEETYPWHREADTLVTDKGSVNARSVHRVEDVTKFTPLFTEALVAQLAADMAFPITKSNAFAQQKKIEAEAAITKAQAAEGAEGSMVVWQDSTLRDARQ